MTDSTGVTQQESSERDEMKGYFENNVTIFRFEKIAVINKQVRPGRLTVFLAGTEETWSIEHPEDQAFLEAYRAWLNKDKAV